MNALENKILGCLAAGLIGDAMGAPVESRHYEWIEQNHGWVESFEGQGTDDSAVKAIIADAIKHGGGYIDADGFAESMLRNDQYFRLFYTPVRNAFAKLRDKVALPVDAGNGNMQSSSSAMAIAPMGIINACNPRRAAMETYDVAGVIHSGLTNFCRDGACAIAAAVAEAMKPNATCESVVEASTRYLHPVSAALMIQRITETVALAKAANDFKVFRSAFYERFLYGEICDSRETVPATIALFWLAEGDPNKAVMLGANFGRDADTIATMVGAIAGAFKGADAIRPEWLAQVTENNPAQQKMAELLLDAINTRLRDDATVAGNIDAMR